MGAKYGVDVLRAAGHAVLGMSGRLGQSPLGVREAEASTGLRVFLPWELQGGALVGIGSLTFGGIFAARIMSGFGFSLPNDAISNYRKLRETKAADFATRKRLKSG